MSTQTAEFRKLLDRHYASIAKRGEERRIIFFKAILSTENIDEARKIVAASANNGLIRSFERFVERIGRDQDNPIFADLDPTISENYQFLSERAEQYFRAMGGRSLTVVSASDRQGRARKPARRSGGKKAASDDGDGGGDGEPPRPRHPQQLLSYASLAQLLDVSVGTLRNKVSAGRFPKPFSTPFGPRFTAEHIDFAINHTPPAPATRSRGRPRIAQSLGKGGAA